MTVRLIFSTFLLLVFLMISCNNQEPTCISKKELDASVESTSAKKEPHRYGGWYCPDNFGFKPVDIQKLDQVPAISHRLPTEEELKANMSLINVDKEKHPDARALAMDLPRVAMINEKSHHRSEMIIVIQAIVVNEDTIVGFRYPNGGNGSDWMSNVTFLDDTEVKALGPLPYFYEKSVIPASKEDIWNALGKTDYFKKIGQKFDQSEFFSSEWTVGSERKLTLDTEAEKADGYVGTVFGNAYMQIDYNRNGSHYSEKLLMMENHEDKTTELHFASGPFLNDYETKNTEWTNWFESVSKVSQDY